MVSIKNATKSDIPQIRILAERIWWPTYSSFLKDEQIHFMLSNLYSESKLEDSMNKGETFLLLHDRDGFQGFISYSRSPEGEHCWKINKLYVLPENHGKGYGRKLLEEVSGRARAAGITTLLLNVNRYNPAFNFYKKIGFVVLREEDIPIGQYWMNDYVMKLDI